jgi:fluoride exporter
MRSLPHDPRKLLAIYAGGVVGALLRVGLAEAASTSPGQWPWATFVANMVGALLLGYFFALFRDHPEESLHHPFLGIGVCGTLTTFSTMQLELFEMVDGAHLGLATAYCAVTIAAGYLLLRLGIAAERRRGAFVSYEDAKAPRREER